MLKFHSKHRDELVKQVRRRNDGYLLAQDITWKRTAYVVETNGRQTAELCIPMEININILSVDPLPDTWVDSGYVMHVREGRICYKWCDTAHTKTVLRAILRDYGYIFVEWLPAEKPERE